MYLMNIKSSQPIVYISNYPPSNKEVKLMMIIDTYKEKEKKAYESKLAKAYKDGVYQEKLLELMNGKKGTFNGTFRGFKK